MLEERNSLFAIAPLPEPSTSPAQMPEDLAARRSAIDTHRSILVQAPAGAGKTALLTQRYLALLAEVEDPEQILAITFTRAATAEMRSRILQALEAAQQQQPGEGEEMPLARAALRHAHRQGWRLLEQPHRLDVQTIDSLCLRLAHAQPLLARLGGALQPTEDAGALYASAARRTTALLGRSDLPELHEALRILLLRRDNNLREVESLLARMLARRDAWLGVLPLDLSEEVDWDLVRRELEQPFADENNRVLQGLRAAIDAMPELTAELLELGRYAARNRAESEKKGLDLQLLLQAEALPGGAADHRDHWLAWASLLLKADNDWRGRWIVSEGFPSEGRPREKEILKHWQQRMRQCCEGLQAHPQGGAYLQLLLCQLRSLPPLHYTQDQWRTLLAVFRVLRRAAAELRLVFAETSTVDFVEIAQAAEQVLSDEACARGMLESERKRHILIDEFQDTSRSQYRLIAQLLREWSHGDGRTVFLVGDPLQSIYGFRQAEVALFHETRERGLPCGSERRHACHPLQLTHNFRSHRTLVDRLNKHFAIMFAGSSTDAFVAASAWPLAQQEDSFQLHPFFIDEKHGQDAAQARINEAAEVTRILTEELPRIAEAEARGQDAYRVAVLVRSRSHLSSILPAIRAAAIPYRAVELEPLANQPEVHDLLMLLRALLHTGDRNAWLTVLRAPWCGLLLRDLHVLAGDDDPALLARPLIELIETRAPLLSADGQTLLARTWAALREAMHTRYAGPGVLSLSQWLERTWRTLGGPSCVDRTQRDNVEALFCLLDSLQPSGLEVFRNDFAQRLETLCAAPSTEVNERYGIQLMTMHKAKGLGFEVVLLPGLERKTGQDTTELLAMLERARPGAALRDELLLAPVGNKEDGQRGAYDWVASRRKQREADERKRLFYVACTRARTRLHLFATVTVANGELRKPDPCSLLHSAWPALGDELEGCRATATPAPTLALAASAEPSTIVSLQTISRLPASWAPGASPQNLSIPGSTTAAATAPLFARTEGSLAARARGTAMHALLERLASLWAQAPGTEDPEIWRGALVCTAEHSLRSASLPISRARSLALELAAQVLAAAAHPHGRWLLQPHPAAQAEGAWQAFDASGALRTLRVDRSFIAGEQPGEAGESCLWIVDYKTGVYAAQPLSDMSHETWIGEQKMKWQPQLKAYGSALSAAATQLKPLRYALFFPELPELVWWAPNQDALIELY